MLEIAEERVEGFAEQGEKASSAKKRATNADQIDTNRILAKLD